MKLALQANIGIITTFIVAILLVLLMPQINNIPILIIVLLVYIDITLYKVAFEYQRVSLTIARIAKMESSSFSHMSIPEIQLLLSSSKLSFLFYLTSFLTGFIIAYLYLSSILFLIAYLFVKYLFSMFIPTYIPYKLLFKFMGLEFEKTDLRHPQELIYKTLLRKYFDDMPHSRKYESWAFEKYGTEIVKIK